jgi:hypothetical protein
LRILCAACRKEPSILVVFSIFTWVVG